MTQQSLATAVGYSIRTISRLEQGGSTYIENLSEIAEALNVEIELLLTTSP